MNSEEESLTDLAELWTILKWKSMYPEVTEDQIRQSIRGTNPDSLGPEKRKTIARRIKAHYPEISEKSVKWFLDQVNEINFPLTNGEEAYRRRQKECRDNYEKILDYSDLLIKELNRFLAFPFDGLPEARIPADPVASSTEFSSVRLHASDTRKKVSELRDRVASWPKRCSSTNAPVNGTQERIKVFRVAILFRRLNLPDEDGNRLSLNKNGRDLTLFQFIIRKLWPEIKDGTIQGALNLYTQAQPTLSNLSELAPELFGPYSPE